MSTDEIIVARAAAAAAQRVPGVASLGRGLFADAATYDGGQTIRGIAVVRCDNTMACDVHVIAAYPDAPNLLDLADRVRNAVRWAVEESGESVRRIDVAVDDLIVQGQAQ
ncbi:MAG: hypothetical protein JWO48_3794 [Bryobacterales bacterium]|nr:hypothetical protein [Bryobacterales bacterium]